MQADKIKAQKREWYLKNKDRIRQQQKQYNALNRKHLREKARIKRLESSPEKEKIRSSKWRLANPEKAAHSRRTTKLLHKYKITDEQYNTMLVAQNNVCAICKKPETRRHKNGTLTRLTVDHCHYTGKVRGLLCHACNVSIGLLKENIETIKSAINYLELHAKA